MIQGMFSSYFVEVQRYRIIYLAIGNRFKQKDDAIFSS